MISPWYLNKRKWNAWIAVSNPECPAKHHEVSCLSGWVIEVCHIATHYCAWSCMNQCCYSIRHKPLFWPLENNVVWCCLLGAILGFCVLSPCIWSEHSTNSHSHSFEWLIISLLLLVSSLFDANHPTQTSQLHFCPTWHFGGV